MSLNSKTDAGQSQSMTDPFYFKKKWLIYALLFAATALMLSQLWGIAFTSGDDPFIAVDRFRKGGVWAAAVKQAIGQGRFYYILPWGLSEISYLPDSFETLNIIKIISNILMFSAYFAFVRELSGTRTAVLTCFIGVALFDAIGGSFNPFHGIPLWYGTGATFLLASLTLYVRACKTDRRFFIPYLLYFISLLFYEPILFYSAAFIFIYFFYSGENWRDWKKFLSKLLLENRWLWIWLFVYFLSYAVFRHYFPSNYEGSKELTLDTPRRIIATIVKFSLTGVFGRFFPKRSYFHAVSGIFTALIAVGAWMTLFSFPTKKTEEAARQKNPFQLLLGLGAIGFFIFAPNLLFGFVEKYRVWASLNPYYLGSYFSAFAVFLFLGVLISFVWDRLSGRILKAVFATPIVAALSVVAFLNYSNYSHYFGEFRIDALRWPLMKSVIDRATENTVAFTSICTKNFIPNEDIYDYWSTYLSARTGKTVKLIFTKTNDPKCDLYADYRILSDRVTLDLTPVDGRPGYHSEIPR